MFISKSCTPILPKLPSEDMSNIGHVDTKLDASQSKEHAIEIIQNAANETGFSTPLYY